MRLAIVQHTCKNKGNAASIEKNAPFRSTIKFLEDGHSKSEPFLGMGYYLWDNNMEWAHKWGASHYLNNYRILQGTLRVDEDYLFDLLANTEHTQKVLDLYSIYKPLKDDDEIITLCGLIEAMKYIARKDPGYFPYKLIRAEDKKKSTELLQFSIQQPNVINLKPCIIYCLIEMDTTILYDLKLIA